MIEIWYSGKGVLHELRIVGHAGYAPAGEDIVCAGISAITFALAGSLDENADIRMDDGDVVITSPKTDKTTALFGMAVVGYGQHRETFPDYVTLHVHQSDGDSRE